jgi:glycosyltransferase involved in cell wall biosynthesis
MGLDGEVERPVKIIFVSYGQFLSNSGAHIANFANELAKKGHSVAVCATGSTFGLSAYGQTRFVPVPAEQIEQAPASVGRFDGVDADPADTIIHCWTPREKVRVLTERLLGAISAPYVVHLEDNEELLTASNLNQPWPELSQKSEEYLDAMVPPSLSHPVKYKQFMSSSAGATVIVDTLRAFVPHGLPSHVLEPGVDFRKFSPAKNRDAREALLTELGVDADAKVIVYHGNMHVANQREVFSLYCAVNILRRRGVNAWLLRAGNDYSPGLDVSFDHLRKASVSLGYLDDKALISILKTADAFVQPGAVDEFNIYRLPSKLPEFLALGRPVLLPGANIGRSLQDGSDAIILKRGDGVEIADRLMEVFHDEAKARSLGENARRYAKKHLNWSDKAGALDGFYNEIIQNHSNRAKPELH